MRSFTEPLLELGDYRKIKEELIKQEGIVQVSGCIDAQKPHFMYGSWAYYNFSGAAGAGNI